MRAGWVWAAMLALLPCFAWGAAPAVPKRDYRITGQVVNTRDGSPVPYCRVMAGLVPENQVGTVRAGDFGGRTGPAGGFGGRGPGRPGGRVAPSNDLPPETRSDAEGRFELAVPRAGAWRVSATARGFRPQMYDEHDGFFSAVVLTEDAPAYELTFRLAPDPALTGLVTDEEGEPVENAMVVAELLPSPEPGAGPNQPAAQPRQVGSTQTDDRGRYEISGLAPGRYHVRVQAQPWYANQARQTSRLSAVNPGAGGGSADQQTLDPSLDTVYATTWFPGTDDEQSAEAIRLGPGEERQADFHLIAIPSIHLRIPKVTQPEGQSPGQNGVFVNRTGPRANAAVVEQPMLVSNGSGSQPVGVLKGDYWEFSGLAPGSYELRMGGPGNDQNGNVKHLQVKADSPGMLSVDAATSLIRVEVDVEGSREGPEQAIQLVDTDTGGMYFAAMPQRGRRGGRGDDEDADGGRGVRTVMVPPHAYQVFVQGNSNEYLTKMTADGAKVAGRTVTIDGPAKLHLKVSAEHAQIDGVARLDGKPAAGALVLLVPATLGQPGNLMPVARDETNTDGTFLISGVVPGAYIAVVVEGGWDVDWQQPEMLAKYLVHGVPVELKASGKVHEALEAVER